MQIITKSKTFTMKKILIALCFAGISLNSVSAQLTLEKVNSKKKVSIPNGSLISLRFPTKTTNLECDCYFQYNGKLVQASKDSLTIVIDTDVRIYADEYGVRKSTYQQYKYAPNREISTILRSNNATLVIKENPNMESLNNFGGVLMVLSIFNQLVLSPLYGSELRKTSDYISWGTFSLGLTFALLPNKKRYYITQPKNGGKTLWRLSQ
jgi:hypothetical protein